MLTVATVATGNYLGRGEEYVEKLRRAVLRNLCIPHRFEVLREGPASWWAKVELFRPGRFTGRVLYFDLDTLIVGSLERLVQHTGILHLADWGWKRNDYGSGVMVWDAGEHSAIWTRYTQDVPNTFRGDQDWITHLRDAGVDSWDALPKGLCVSYRYVSQERPPAGACVVAFHGKPKPHEVTEGWVPGVWR